MLNLIKYEWLRRWKFFLAGIIAFLAANVDIISRLIKQENPTALTAVLCGILFALGMALVFDQIGRIYRPLFTDEGFLELTLPLNGYQYLGAKALAVAIEFGAVALFVVLVAYLDLVYINWVLPDWQLASITWAEVLDFLQAIGLTLGVYLIFILMIYLSLTLAKSLFASLKHGKLITFVAFLLVFKALDYFIDCWNIVRGYGNFGLSLTIAAQDWFLIAVVIGILFAGTGYLLDRKINL